MSKNTLGQIKQWGFLVKDLDQAMASWVEELGVGPFWGFRNVQLESDFKNVQTEVIMDVGLAYQNGVQIELIHQTNDTHSPYSDFYVTNQAQFFQHVAYHCFDIDAGRKTATELGMKELGHVHSAMGTRYHYFESPRLDGILVELMEVEQGIVDAFDACAEETLSWDGNNPYRLISF